jgi:hypothetical protein
MSSKFFNLRLKRLLSGVTLVAFLSASVSADAITVDNITVQSPQNGVAADPGTMGEDISSSVPLGSAITLTTTATPYNLTSFTLTAGQWRCSATVIATAAGTTFPSLIASFSATSATLPTAPSLGYAQSIVSATTGVGGITTGVANIQIGGLTTYYLVVQGAFTGTAPTVYGKADCLRVR